MTQQAAKKGREVRNGTSSEAATDDTRAAAKTARSAVKFMDPSAMDDTPVPFIPYEGLPGAIEPALQAELYSLNRQICHLLPDRPCRVVQFAGICGMEGTTTFVRKFARSLAEVEDSGILLLDGQGDHLPAGAGTTRSGGGLPDTPEPAAAGSVRSIAAEHCGGLWLSPIPAMNAGMHKRERQAALRSFIERVRPRFGLVLVESPPVLASRESLLMTREVDGVVLVVRRDLTRSAETRDAKTQIESIGGRVLGVVFNKHG